MTIDERARKIHSYVCGCNLEGQCVEFIAAELRAVQREALEKAAEIAESGLVQVKKEAPYATYLDAWSAIREAIAERIRKLAEEL